ncbi:MAG: iron-containing alcohol dehydrogenase, partial [Firmicutes bacterium]|nr:iron-containing alcohol dehydrogenase [Bacillota bacterium]
KKGFAIFATAASMDGFASDSAPITRNGFKRTYPAKAPEVVVADTRILAAAPEELKSAGFGDMMGKYIGLIDWRVSHLLSGEYYCEKVAFLTRRAADTALALCNEVLSNHEEVARQMFEALVLTGIGMSFAGSTRPGSGTEHILSHFWECMKLRQGELSDYHGKKVGVATLLIGGEYEALAKQRTVTAKTEKIDWNEVYQTYGELANEVRELNNPTITEGIDPRKIENSWGNIRQIVYAVPPSDQIESALKAAGCPTDISGIGIAPELGAAGVKYHPFMRRRLSLMRLKTMIQLEETEAEGKKCTTRRSSGAGLSAR